MSLLLFRRQVRVTIQYQPDNSPGYAYFASCPITHDMSAGGYGGTEAEALHNLRRDLQSHGFEVMP